MKSMAKIRMNTNFGVRKNRTVTLLTTLVIPHRNMSCSRRGNRNVATPLFSCGLQASSAKEDTFQPCKIGRVSIASCSTARKLSQTFTWKVLHLLEIYPRLRATPHDVNLHPLLGTSHLALHCN